MLPPILVVCLLPLGRLFWYLREQIEFLVDRANVELAQAKKVQNKERIEEMEEQEKCLQETTIWPNGSVAGSTFLICMIALVVGTVFPPVLLLFRPLFI
jgi:hypothetical protein